MTHKSHIWFLFYWPTISVPFYHGGTSISPFQFSSYRAHTNWNSSLLQWRILCLISCTKLQLWFCWLPAIYKQNASIFEMTDLRIFISVFFCGLMTFITLFWLSWAHSYSLSSNDNYWMSQMQAAVKPPIRALIHSDSGLIVGMC